MMDANVRELQIEPLSLLLLDYQEKKKKSPTLIIALYILLYIVNIAIAMDIGAVILYKDDQSYVFLLFPLSIIGTLTYSLLPNRMIYRLCSKANVLFSLLIHFIFLTLFFTSKDYLFKYSCSHFFIILSKAFISLTQTSLTLFTLQWVQHFSPEANRLILISSVQLTPLLGIIFGILLEYFFQYAFYIQMGVIGVVGIVFILVPQIWLQNKTKEETEEFLRKSTNLSNKSAKEIMKYGLLFLAVICYYTIITFIFSIIFLNEFRVGVESNYVIWTFCVISLIIPLIGLLLGGFITHNLTRYNNVIAVNMILETIALVFCFVVFFNKLSSTVDQIYLGLMLLFQMSTIPFCLKAINQFSIFIESKQLSFKIITFTTNLFGLFCGGIIGSLFPESNIYIIFISSLVSFAFYSLFCYEYFIHYQKDKLIDVPLHKYQIFLIIANAYGKIALFVWNEYDGESLVRNKSTEKLIDLNVISLSSSFEADKSERLTHQTSNSETDASNRLSQMTFQNNRTTYNSSRIEQAQRFTFNN